MNFTKKMMTITAIALLTLSTVFLSACGPSDILNSIAGQSATERPAAESSVAEQSVTEQPANESPAAGQSQSRKEKAAVLDDHTYRDDAAGFEITYPDDFYVMSQKEIQDFFSENIQYFKDYYNDPEEAEKAIEQTIPISIALKYPLGYEDGYNPNLNVIIIDMEEEFDGDAVELVRESIQYAQEMSDNISYTDVEPVVIDGKDAAIAYGTSLIEGYTIPQKQYYIFNRHYNIIITISADDNQSEEEMDQIINTIKLY